MKLCKKCNTAYTDIENNFHKKKTTLDGFAYSCKGCTKIYKQTYKIANPKQAQKDRDASKKRARGVRQKVLTHYGAICKCCGETTEQFLCLDHVKGGGNKHRNEIGSGSYMYLWIIANNYPDIFQVLCHNCNTALGLYGFCPHHPEVIREVLVGK